VANKLYNQKIVAVNTASVGDNNQRAFTFKGFDSNSKATNYKLHDIDIVKRDLLNHFYIRRGEKLENPKFGTVIWDMLFEPFTESTKSIIAKDVETIVNYDPRLRVDSVVITTTDMGISIDLTLTYMPFDISQRMTLNFDKNNAVIA
jgi:phage baseplate assembly protein W